MERKVGTVSRGIRCPIIREGDDLAKIVVDSVLEAAKSEGFDLRGLSFKINLMAKYDKFNLFSSDGGDGDWDEGDWEDYASRAYDDDEEDWGDYDDYAADYKWKRFQMGWHIGARASYNSWTLGLRYGLDFMEIAKKCSTSTFTVSVGYKF